MYIVFSDYFKFLSLDKFRNEVPYNIKFNADKLYIAKYNFNNETPENLIPFTQTEINNILQNCINHIADSPPYIFYKNKVLSPSDKILLLTNNSDILSIEEFDNNQYFYCNTKTGIEDYINNFVTSNLQNINNYNIYAEYSSDSEISMPLKLQNTFYKIPFEKKLTNSNTLVLNTNTIKYRGISATDFLCSFNCNLSISSNSETVTVAFFKNNIKEFSTVIKITNGSNTVNLINMRKIITLNSLDELDVRISNTSSNNKAISIFNSVFSVFI